MNTDFVSRCQKLRHAMVGASIDTALITGEADLRYLTGIAPSDAHGGILVLSSVRDTLLLREKGTGTPAIPHGICPRFYSSDEEVGRLLSPLLKGVVAAEKDALPPLLREQLSRNGAALQDLTHLLSALRIYKDPAELAALEEACQRTDRILSRWRQALRPGATEEALLHKLHEISRDFGVSESCPGILIASGPNSSLPHGGNTTRPLQPGDPIFIDCGARWQGYYCDITRTFFLGAPDQEMRKVYQTVLEAQQAAITAIRPGISVGEVDAAARHVIESAGYGTYFTHRTGHGLGLAVHESPSVGPGGDQKLFCGMVITVEPGIYLPGRWGVRIEDDVVVEQKGARILNRFPKELSDMVIPL